MIYDTQLQVLSESLVVAVKGKTLSRGRHLALNSINCDLKELHTYGRNIIVPCFRIAST
jgi:hypothetical protein